MSDSQKAIDGFEVREMNWFSVNILFRSSVDDEKDEDRLWEERILVFLAKSVAEARVKAEDFAKKEEISYLTMTQENLKWNFIKVDRIKELDSECLRDGLEIFSRYLKNSEVESMSEPFDS